MQFELKDEYIELYKLIKLLDLVDSGAQAKMIVADGYVLRNAEVETRKRAKIINLIERFKESKEIVIAINKIDLEKKI